MSAHVLLIVTGGIAAYKAAALTRLLVTSGYRVRVVMTEAGAKFVTPLTFEALTGEPCFGSLWEPRLGSMEHIDLARWADLVVVAPATADFLARMAAGMGDELATTLLLAAEVPVLVAPAMNPSMWAHAATRENMAKLEARGVARIGPGSGDTACREPGEGRMAEPEAILEAVARRLSPGAGAATEAGAARPAPAGRDLAGRRVLITGGPTREFLDPARFLSNPSTGRMAFALAEEARDRGAAVTLVLGPVEASPPVGVRVVPVVSAAEMHAAVMGEVGTADVFVAAAAVADWTPRVVSPEKEPKSEGPISVELVRTRDILAEVAAGRRAGLVVVGFAAQTGDVLGLGLAKMRRKGADLMLVNEIGREGTGFGAEATRAALLEAGRPLPELVSRPKRELAKELFDRVAARLG